MPPPPSPLTAAQALATQARVLDSRLRAAHQSDRQTTRRAAAHLTALARRLSAFLSRNPSLLPAVPSGSRRVRHHVLHVLPEPARDAAIMGEPIEESSEPVEIQILTLGTNGMLRLGTMQPDGALIWREVDVMDPPPGWEIDVLLRLLGRALGRVEEHVAAVESRVRDRARALTRLMDGTRKAAPPAEEATPAPAAKPKVSTLDEAIELATRKLAAVAPDPAPPAATAPTPAAAAAAAAKKGASRKHLFERLRDR